MDGQGERVNQQLEQTLRAFINYKQDNWVSLLSFIEFSINGQRHSATGHSPFFLMYGFEPSYGLDSNTESVAPAADERLTQMKKNRDGVIAALLIAADPMKDYHDRNLSKNPNFKPGDLVWLDARNLQRL